MVATTVQRVESGTYLAAQLRKLENLDQKTKNIINISANGAATAMNFFTFLNGNLFHNDAIQEKMEWLSNVLTKVSTAAQGFVNYFNAKDKKNAVALTGAALEIPIALFSSGFNLFLARGVSAGMNQFDSIIRRTKIRDADGKVTTNNEGQEQYYETFKDKGYIEGFKVFCVQAARYLKETFTKPLEKEERFPRWFSLCSTFMILGPVIFALKLEKLGALLRDFFGGAAAVALLADKEPKKNQETSQPEESKQEKSHKKPTSYVLAGIFWTIGAITDYLKRIPFIADRASNITELSLGVDRIGAIFYTIGNKPKTEQVA